MTMVEISIPCARPSWDQYEEFEPCTLSDSWNEEELLLSVPLAHLMETGLSNYIQPFCAFTSKIASLWTHPQILYVYKMIDQLSVVVSLLVVENI